MNRDVLIPRPETESLVQAVLDWIRDKKFKSGNILDLGTGSGCIAISLQKNLPAGFEVYAVDSSAGALKIAKENAECLGAKISLQEMDMFKAELPQKFKVIVSNPPYIPLDDLNKLQPDIRNYEPLMALDAGPEGLQFFECIIDRWINKVEPTGLLAMETYDNDQRTILKSKLEKLSKRIWSDGPHLFSEF